MSRAALGRAFLASALAREAPAVAPDAVAFLDARAEAQRSVVTEVPLAALSRWRLDGQRLAHETGRFFSVEGLAVETTFGAVPRWTQPIILQPEIGILGFLTQRAPGPEGVLRFLCQAKMEPGNRGVVQLAPTVQATPSNYLRVHGGRATPYLERFLPDGRAGGRVLVDALLSEQGSRYLRKRNRNLIIEVPPGEAVPVAPDFAWLTLGQIGGLLRGGGRVNMNARTVLACAHVSVGDAARAALLAAPPGGEALRGELLASRLHRARDPDAELRAALSWLHDEKGRQRLDARRIPLSELEGWRVDGAAIRHESGRFFRVIGVEVSDASREVGAWGQPMIAPAHDGVVAFVAQRRGGVLEVLVQARAEPGLFDALELAPTLQLAPGDYGAGGAPLPPLAELLTGSAGRVRWRAPQSEDGGRFYHDDKEHLLIELPEDEPLAAPPGYRWMTLGLLERLVSCGGYIVGVEARSLLACLAG